MHLDITERKRAQAEVEFLARHDTLTKLPNRDALIRHVEALLDRPEAARRPFALLFLDLDGPSD